MELLTQLYIQYKGQPPASVAPITGSGSHRAYYRLSAPDGSSLIGVVGTGIQENEAFFQITQTYINKGLPVPQLLACSGDHLRYLLSDLGSLSLYDLLAPARTSGHYSHEHEQMLHSTIAQLPHLQFQAATPEVFAHCYPIQQMDEESIRFDLNYFKYCFLKLTGIDFDERALEADFRQLTHALLDVEPQSEVAFQYRDFQARNVMICRGRPHFIDYQGGRRGPIYYDLASFLYQASARYPDDLRSRLIDTYRRELAHYVNIPAERFHRQLHTHVLFRTLQVLGAYGLRGLYERKAHFLNSIPHALQQLQTLLEASPCYPTLTYIASHLSITPPLLGRGGEGGEASPSPWERGTGGEALTVTILSFSYKRGLPDDPSGNGGGYIFDMRAPHNPGRLDAYKTLTGCDQPVIDYIEADGELPQLLEHIYHLADFHVQRYIDRGFTHLQFAFGCTGGQHRSVYSAEHLTQHLRQRFPHICIELRHREQHHWPSYIA